jgi:hypothetical protein
MTRAPSTARTWFVFGSEAAPAPPLRLRAGPLQLLFEPASGFIRGVRSGEREVLRGLYAAVRDRDWGTVPPHISHLESQVSDEAFTLTFDAACRRGDIHFLWKGFIRGQPDGSLLYEFDGEARSTFLRNRIGLCVLHPIRECAGAAARQTRVDGSVVECRFPTTIEPQIFGQGSFRDLRSVAHEIAPGLWAEVEFEGDVFEMEDQRNWTDASFKTYGTPLTLPFPVEIQAGARIRQRVTLRLRTAASSVAGSRVTLDEGQPEVVTVSVPNAPIARLPHIGLGISSHGEALTEAEAARLRALRLSHLRVDLRLSMPRWPAVWEQAARDAGQLGVGLELALHLPRDGGEGGPELRRLLQEQPAALSRVLALREGEAATTQETLRRVRQALRGIDAPIGAGSDANFCELNREQALRHLAISEADFLFWPINPQVHAFDNLSILETLEAHAATVQTARTFAGSKPLVVSPITLRPRFNAVATGTPRPVDRDELPPTVDPRQLSLFAAAWALGSLAALAGAGVESVSLCETTGWRGIMEREGGAPLPDAFPSLPGSVFPVYHLLADLAGAASVAVPCVHATSRLAALTVFDSAGRWRTLLANLTPHPQRVRLTAGVSSARVRALDADFVAAAMRDPEEFRARAGARLVPGEGEMELRLLPHALACLEEVAGQG